LVVEISKCSQGLIFILYSKYRKRFMYTNVPFGSGKQQEESTKKTLWYKQIGGF